MIPFACNYDPNADFYDGSCDFACLYGTAEMGFNHEMACNYGAADEPCLLFNAEGQTCIPGGCLMESACNYDSDAVYSDGSCDFDSCITFGCTFEQACNFNPLANTNDGSCDFGSCQVVVSGCTNPLACNFQDVANHDDGSCDFASCLTSGCTLPNACNYDANAAIHDGSCAFPAEGMDAMVHAFRTPTPTACVTSLKFSVAPTRVRSISTWLPPTTTALVCTPTVVALMRSRATSTTLRRPTTAHAITVAWGA